MVYLLWLQISHLFYTGTTGYNINALAVPDQDVLKVILILNDILKGMFGIQSEENIDVGQTKIRIKETGLMP